VKIDKAVNLIQLHERTARDKYENGKKENARAPAQKPEDIPILYFWRLLRLHNACTTRGHA
jgi:hypothetical protein